MIPDDKCESIFERFYRIDEGHRGPSGELHSGFRHLPAGRSLTANELGMHDMSGNVHELVFNGFGTNCPYKGGSWISTVEQLEPGYSATIVADTVRTNIGFRLAMNTNKVTRLKR